MRLLLVEDDTMLGASLKRGLAQAGHAVEWVADGEEALLALKTNGFDAVVLDIGLPRISGLEVLRSLRERGQGSLPVLMLTAMDAVEYRVRGLDAGADDYLTKPFDFDELLARIRALTRRAQSRADASLRCGEVELDPAAKMVLRASQPVPLTAKELRICTLLMERRNRIVSKAEIEETLYGWNEEVDSNTVEVSIYTLRKKLGKDFITTIRGVGYMVRA